MFNKFTKWFTKLPDLTSPIIHELPITITFVILSRVWSLFTDGEAFKLNEILCFIGIWCLYIYIITASIFYTKKKWLRVAWYILLFTIYTISVFIWYNFKMELGPTPLSLIVETDSREAGEFLDTFLFSYASIISYIKVTICIIIALILEIV